MSMPTPPPFPALQAAGISYENLVALFALVQERAAHSSPSEILDFLREDLSGPKFSHLSKEQRARLQISLRSLQEYALDIWRRTTQFQASSPSGGYAVIPHSGAYAVVPPSGGYPVVPPSGAYAVVPHSGAYAVVPPSGAYPTISPSGAYSAVHSIAPLQKPGILSRLKRALGGFFRKVPKERPVLSTGEIAAALSTGE